MVSLETSDDTLKKLMDAAEAGCKRNIRDFCGRRVLIEGGGYHKIWLETQPMGGAMYAKRDMEVAVNNQLLFMEHQRADGRLPGSIAFEDGRVIPQFNKFQGFCFPMPALEVYFLSGRDPAFLDLLADSLERFDAYLWRTRDSDGDGCLESWCRYDTGEDNAVRYGDAPDAWEEEEPPAGRSVVPIASMDVMSYSYSAREVLARISRIRGREEDARRWMTAAGDVAAKIRQMLWDEERGALFDRDRHHNRMPQLIHNTLRAMYWHSISQDMADRFVKEHLLNPGEFWTPMPLPSVAVNDPDFKNVPTNDWSGQVQALTYQRAIRALENYGYYQLIPVLGRKLFNAVTVRRDDAPDGACSTQDRSRFAFVQQFDPFTMEASQGGTDDAEKDYGPALLSVLEYCARMYGVDRSEAVRPDRNSGAGSSSATETEDRLVWGICPGPDVTYEQLTDGHRYKLVLDGGEAVAQIDGKQIFRVPRSLRVETDLEGKTIFII